MNDGGIVFFRSTAHTEVVEFYTQRVGATTWLEQPDCTILEYQGFRFGFCDRDAADTEGIITFLIEDRAGVDAVYDRLRDIATEAPAFNETYDIYQFFASDPEGRTVEFQTFE